MDLQAYMQAIGVRSFGWPLPAASSSAAESTLALSSAYSYGSNGASMFFMYRPYTSGNLTDFWVKVASYGPSTVWGSTDGVINVQIREGLNGSGIPGTTLTGSFTITLDGTTTGWIKKTGLSIALTAGVSYCFVIGDADGGATHFVNIVRSSNASHQPGIALGSTYYHGTNGFSTAGTAVTGCSMNALKYDGQLHGGMAYSSINTITSSGLERGMRFRLPENATFVGWGYISDGPFPGWTMKLYADGTAPGGTALVSHTHSFTGTGSNPVPNHILMPVSDHYSLVKNTWYRLVLDPPSNSTVPRKAVIGGTPDSELLAACMPLAGNLYATTESGGGWADETDAAFLFAPLFVLNTDATGGGEPSSIRIE